MKKLLAVVLSLITALSVVSLAGCGGKNNKKVELIWATPWYESEESELVQKVFNEELQKLLPNTTVKFKLMSSDNWSLMMSGQEPIDIAWAGYLIDVLSEVKKGSYTPLDDLIKENAPNIAQEMKDDADDYEKGNYDGKQYLIPNQQARVKHSGSLVVPASLYKYLDVDALLTALKASPYLTEDILKVLDSYFEKVFASSDYDNDVVGKYISIENIYGILAKRGYDQITASVVYKAFDENPKFVSFYETDEYKLFCKYASKWYEKGYISTEVLTSAGSGSRSAIMEGNFTNDWYLTTVEGKGEAKGVIYNFDEGGNIKEYRILTRDTEQMYKGIKQFASDSTYLTIPYTAKNPERAIKLLDLLRSDKGRDLFTLLCYGFKKDSDLAKKYNTYHYTVNENGTAQGVDYIIQPSSTSKYGIPSWTCGNCLKTYLNADLDPGVVDYLKDYNKNVSPKFHKTKYYNFMPDTTDIDIDITNVTAAYNEYDARIHCGTEGSKWEATYKTMINKINAANLQNIKDTIEKQAKEYADKK